MKKLLWKIWVLSFPSQLGLCSLSLSLSLFNKILFVDKVCKTAKMCKCHVEKCTKNWQPMILKFLLSTKEIQVIWWKWYLDHIHLNKNGHGVWQGIVVHFNVGYMIGPLFLSFLFSVGIGMSQVDFWHWIWNYGSKNSNQIDSDIIC